MFAWIIYDISDNAVRTKVPAVCLDYGFARFQKSVFCGETDEKTLKKVRERVAALVEIIKEGSEQVFMFTICDSCMKNQVTIGKEIEPGKMKRPSLIIIG